ncbi:MAG: alpha/beta hydrolase [Ignavibacteria bacterium]|jgi:pimeloyl-ACP methyl ester carboxylesterase
MKKTLAVLFTILVLCPVLSAQVKSKDGTEIKYSVEGKGEPALVFVHCWCCDKSYWDYQVEEMSQNYKVVAVDLAGHGESGTRKNYTIEGFGEDVESVVNHLGLDQIILIGHSMGGAVVIEAAQLLGNKVIGLIGIDNFQDLDPERNEEEIKQFMEAMGKDFQGTTYGYVSGMMFPEGADSMLVKKIADDMSNGPAEVGISAMANLIHYNYVEEIKQLNIPVININADKWPTNLEKNQKIYPKFDVRIIKGTGHFLNQEKPDEFNNALKEVVAELMK